MPTEIKNRGLDDEERLPHYPYRDDGMLIWNTIREFVSDYLKHFYMAPQDILNDTELQGWAKELSNSAADGGGNVQGMPTSFATIEELIEVVTTIIFICGPLHSAVNFSQYDYMAFAANMPLASYLDPNIGSSSQEPITSETILQCLPPHNKSAEQLEILFILSAYRYDKLGYYDKSFRDLYNANVDELFGDSDNEAIVNVISLFQKKLDLVEQKINQRNVERLVSYPYLKPSLILNSISI